MENSSPAVLPPAVPGAGHEAQAGGVEGQGGDGGLVAGEGHLLLARGRVEEPDGAVGVTGRQEGAPAVAGQAGHLGGSGHSNTDMTAVSNCVHVCHRASFITSLSTVNVGCLKATIENLRGSVEKLSPKESVKGGNTALRGSVRAH